MDLVQTSIYFLFFSPYLTRHSQRILIYTHTILNLVSADPFTFFLPPQRSGFLPKRDITGAYYIQAASQSSCLRPAISSGANVARKLARRSVVPCGRYIVVLGCMFQVST